MDDFQSIPCDDQQRSRYSWYITGVTTQGVVTGLVSGHVRLTATATAAPYAVVPSNSTADTECRTWARKFWSRDATDPEVTACVQVAMVDSLKEASGMTSINTTSPRRWAYTCASVMAAAGFMTF